MRIMRGYGHLSLFEPPITNERMDYTGSSREGDERRQELHAVFRLAETEGIVQSFIRW